MSNYRVHLVVDREAGERLQALPLGEPAWIVDSPKNHGDIAELWRVRPDPSHLTGITAFEDDLSAAPEMLAISVLADIDLHHGVYSHQPPYDVLRVIGARRSAELLSEAAEFGLTEVRGADSEFEVYRPEMTEPEAPRASCPLSQ